MGRVFFGGGKVGMTVPIPLPAGYTNLAYIQSSGKQYIKTGFFASSKSRMEIEYQLYDVTKQAAGVAGSNNSSGSARFFVYQTATAGNAALGLGGTAYTFTADTGKHTAVIDAKNVQVFLDGSKISASFTSAVDNSVEVYAFAINKGGTLQYGYAKIYSLRLYENDVLTKNFMPCINASGDIGLYDIVGKQFYGNAGTGTFTGSEVA